ncbi:MAG: S-methyl-5-thioribose-1-phosphate isomerase [Candidatus Omnitrophica bacterium]|nr:S-methyl-5-thioribose-1-phosphate isomerase [Candidatus Omnitrophota bacterium]MCB9747571.1 S-methyl-5-thioribose-1-phosphate isomerase [Candidatus Omnitrophota bacterium]
MTLPTICWQNGYVKLIDQTKLPNKLEFIICRDVKTLWAAIKRLSVRGAPAIGVAAGFGVLLGIKTFKGKDSRKFIQHVNKVCDYLATSRPTAVNLFNALDQMKNVLQRHAGESVENLKQLLKSEALAIYEYDRKVCRAMGDHGAELIKANSRIMTICNAGALATVDYGTALGVMYSAKRLNKKFKVYACETRPLLQGARLTTWELMRAKIDTTLICDSMAAGLMRDQKIDAVFTGADRIAANGDTANKIGTYNLAVLAKFHNIPFYVVAPFSTFDLNISSGKQIPIEQRGSDEVINFRSIQTAPQNVKVFNPAFDVTEAKLISAIVTEQGIIRPPFVKNIKATIKSVKIK